MLNVSKTPNAGGEINLTVLERGLFGVEGLGPRAALRFVLLVSLVIDFVFTYWYERAKGNTRCSAGVVPVQG